MKKILVVVDVQNDFVDGSLRNEEAIKAIPNIVKNGIDCIEFHAMGTDEDEIFTKWQYLNDNFDGFLSVCTSRGKLSDEELVRRIKKMTEGRKPYSTIVQADGFPMSGGADDYKTTLQTVATAEIVQNENLPVYLILSGGTNSKTTELAKMCGIDYNGVAVGSYARKIVKKFVSRDDFWTNNRVVEDALQTVQPLVNTVIL